MANQEKTISDLKNKIETVILESYKKTKDKNFQDLNFVFPRNGSVISYLKTKIKVFNNLDEYSATFLSIHTRAKIALREFKDNEFDGNYLELLRLVLTLPDTLGYGKLKSIKVEIKEDISLINTSEYKKAKDSTDNIILNETGKAKTIHVKAGISGKKLSKQNKEREIEIEELNSIDFEDEEYDNDFNNLDDVIL